MRAATSPTRLAGAVALGFLSIAACAGAAPAGVGRSDDYGSAVEAAKRDTDGGAPGVSADGGARCPHGSLEDPHRGFIRCLAPDEKDAGWLPPAPQPEPPRAEPPPEVPDAGKAPPAVAPVVEIGAPKFENGEVSRVDKAMNGAAGDIARCVAENGGLAGASGNLKVQFLVRARGRAEGVEVLSSKGVGAEAASCVRLLLKNRAIGAPTSDPVGVTVTILLKAGAK